MLTASYRSPERCGFDSRLGLRNCFPKDNLSLTNALRTSMNLIKSPHKAIPPNLLIRLYPLSRNNYPRVHSEEIQEQIERHRSQDHVWNEFRSKTEL